MYVYVCVCVCVSLITNEAELLFSLTGHQGYAN